MPDKNNPTRTSNRSWSTSRRAAFVFMLTQLGLFALSFGCSQSTKPSSSDSSGVVTSDANQQTHSNHATSQQIPSAHDRMLALLRSIRRGSSKYHPYLGSSKADDLREQLDATPSPVPPQFRWEATFELAQLELQQGHELAAINRFLWCRENMSGDTENPAASREREAHLMFELGVAYMRLGETQNCCLRNHPESCILPIQGNGIHTQKEGSQQAIKCFTKVLELMGSDSEPHLMARWMLNIAWMTLGEHPDSVPDEYVISPEQFESSTSFPHFVNIAQKLNLDTFSMSGGAIIDDFDCDGYLDLIVSPWDPNGQLKFFRNQQDGTFEERTEAAGLEGLCGGLNMIQADFNDDGLLDVFVLRGGWLQRNGRHPNSLIRNNGDGTFSDVTLDAGMDRHLPTQTAAWADYDNDGDLDLFIGNESDEQLRSPCQLYRNDGRGYFEDVAKSAGVTNHRYTKAVVWGDFNFDGFPDLYVSNEKGANRLYKNSPDGTFTDIAADVGVDGPSKSFPAWFWDYNNDGKLDLYVSAYAANVGHLTAFYLDMEPTAEPSKLYRGDGKGGFDDVGTESGLIRPDATMGANFGDLDNDGYLDFYLGTGYPNFDSLMPSVMYLNQSGKSFVDITTPGGFGHLQKGHAVSFADLDHDGDQDVFEQMGGAYPGDRFHDAVYENPGLGNHWVTIRVIGVKSNRYGIGARICATVTEDGKPRKIYRHVNSGGSFGANPLRQTIGLGKATVIEKLDVHWPTTGITQSFGQVPVDHFYCIVEGDEQLTPMTVKSFQLGGSK